MSSRYFQYVILALFVSGVHAAPSTTSLAADYFLTTSFSTCSCAESLQTTWATNQTTTTNPTATSATPTVTSPSTKSMSTSFPERLGNCPPGSLSTSNSGSGLSSVSDMCGFEADTSIYGLGNRLGIYLQWVASLITYRFMRDETFSSGAANFIFQLSNFVHLLYITSKKNGNGGGTYAVECWIMLLICIGAVIPGIVLSPNRMDRPEAGMDRDSNPVKGATKTEVLQTALSAATQLFGVWFVFKGMDEMFAPVNSRSVFAFAKVSLYHRYRTYLKVVFVTTAFFTVIQTGLVFQSLLRRPFFVSSFSAVDIIIRAREERHEAVRWLQWIDIFVVNAMIAWFIVYTLSIELLIPWNHITGAHSFGDSGQWIIFVAAICNLVRVLWRWQERERELRELERGTWRT